MAPFDGRAASAPGTPERASGPEHGAARPAPAAAAGAAAFVQAFYDTAGSGFSGLMPKEAIASRTARGSIRPSRASAPSVATTM